MGIFQQIKEEYEVIREGSGNQISNGGAAIPQFSGNAQLPKST